VLSELKLQNFLQPKVNTKLQHYLELLGFAALITIRKHTSPRKLHYEYLHMTSTFCIGSMWQCREKHEIKHAMVKDLSHFYFLTFNPVGSSNSATVDCHLA